ncbi:hypothetical protein D3C71_2063150 [compost metagenome]
MFNSEISEPATDPNVIITKKSNVVNCARCRRPDNNVIAKNIIIIETILIVRII